MFLAGQSFGRGRAPAHCQFVASLRSRALCRSHDTLARGISSAGLGRPCAGLAATAGARRSGSLRSPWVTRACGLNAFGGIRREAVNAGHGAHCWARLGTVTPRAPATFVRLRRRLTDSRPTESIAPGFQRAHARYRAARAATPRSARSSSYSPKAKGRPELSALTDRAKVSWERHRARGDNEAGGTNKIRTLPRPKLSHDQVTATETLARTANPHPR